MASLRKKPNSEFWYACFSLPTGGRTQRSTKLTDRKKAMSLATQWELAASKRVTETQARRVLSDIYEEIHGAPLASATLSDYARQWLDRKKGENAPSTYSAYEHAITEFQASLKTKAEQQITHVTVSDVVKWRDESAKKTTATTANNKLKAVRVLFQSAWREGLIPENVAAKVQSLKQVKTTRRAFTREELSKLLSVTSTEWRGMILAGVYLGQRLGDIAKLTWANIDLKKNVASLITTKTKRTQIIPIASTLAGYLAGLPKPDDPAEPIFPDAFKTAASASGISALSQQFYDILVAAGMAEKRLDKNHSLGKGRSAPRARNEITFHSLRHTATSLLKNAGVSEAVARDIIGHDSAEISRHYTHMDEKSKKDAIDLLPDVTSPTDKKKPKDSKNKTKSKNQK